MTASQPLVDNPELDRLHKRTRRLWAALLSLALLLFVTVAGLVFLFWLKSRALDKAVEDLQFDQFSSSYEQGTDFVTPTVDTIQFMRRGYTIDFDKVEYTQNGLHLSGVVGNATQLWISSLALNFSARPYPYKIRDKWNASKSTFPWWPDDWTIGTAQTTVGLVNPGSTSLFDVTIPNVRQTSDDVQIAVWFSGERYQYLK